MGSGAHMLGKLPHVFGDDFTQLAQTGVEADAELRIARRLQLGFHPQQETVVLAVVGAVVAQHAFFHLRARGPSCSKMARISAMTCSWSRLSSCSNSSDLLAKLE